MSKCWNFNIRKLALVLLLLINRLGNIDSIVVTVDSSRELIEVWSLSLFVRKHPGY